MQPIFGSQKARFRLGLMPSTPAGVMCQILHVSADQMCSVNLSGQRSDSKAVDFRALTHRAEALEGQEVWIPPVPPPQWEQTQARGFLMKLKIRHETP